MLVDNPAVTGALNAVFGAAGWQPPKPGAQVLVNLPEAGPWSLPDGWHMDAGFERPTWPVFAVKLFALFGDVVPVAAAPCCCRGRTGSSTGTGPGSSSRRGGEGQLAPFLRRHPPLGDLLTGAARADLGRSIVGERYEVDGVPIDVVELTGAPGDVVITHIHVFHSVSPNTGDTPRQMLGKGVLAA